MSNYFFFRIMATNTYKLIFFLMLFLLPFFSQAQLDCIVSSPPSTYGPKGKDEWRAYVYQLSENYNPNSDYGREFGGGMADRKYKGHLPYGADFLPLGSVNFDINFGDTSNYSSDTLFFRTDKEWKSNTPGCETQLQDFGVIFRSEVTILPGQSGIYRFRVGSDDGSRLSLTIKEGGVVVKDTVPHNNWGGPKTYNYPENIFNYYIPLEAGQTVNLDLSYYEHKGSNRISFEMIRYLGPGEIEGSQDLCGIAPDPAAFKSRGPAAFLAGNISYQWQHSEIEDSDSESWEDISGATGLTYDVSQFTNGGSAETHYYRRVAINNAAGVLTKYPSNVLKVNVNYIEDIDQQEYGDNEWVGHIYRGKGTFNDDSYLGRVAEDSVFYQNFDYNGTPSSPNSFTPDHGCAFITERFSVRYKMKLDVSPGDYTFDVKGDDGFRLSLDGGNTWVINMWSDGTKKSQYATLSVADTGQVNMVLEYYENRMDNFISFDFDFQSLILPLEWGRVDAEAFGSANCLTWETIQEKNTSHFELERSYNAVDWEVFDKSVSAQGTSTEKVNYAFKDEQFTGSKVYYRIRQVDLDDAFEYSKVMRVDNPYYVKSFLPFPNPTVEKILFYSPQEVVKLFIISNSITPHEELKPNRLSDSRYEVNLSRYRPGTYVILVQTKDGGKEVFKVIKK